MYIVKNVASVGKMIKANGASLFSKSCRNKSVEIEVNAKVSYLLSLGDRGTFLNCRYKAFDVGFSILLFDIIMGYYVILLPHCMANIAKPYFTVICT